MVLPSPIDPSMPIVTLDTIIALLSSVPFFGKSLVKTAIDRSTQRHKCDTCNITTEVNVGDIVKHPLALLSAKGFQSHGSLFKPEDQQHLRIVPSKPIKENDDDKKIRKSASSSSSSPTSAQQQPEEKSMSKAAAAASSSTSSTATSTSNPSSPSGISKEQETINSNVPLAKRPMFNCRSCPDGRLGIYTYKGDSTDGSKEKLVSRIKTVFKTMPDVVEGHMTAQSVDTFDMDDVFWVD